MEIFNINLIKKDMIKILERRINCVRNHNELKPLNCCYQADTLELKSLRKLIMKLNEKNKSS